MLNVTLKKSCKLSSVKGTFIVLNDRGLHTRPSTEIVKCACSYKADVKLICRGVEVNAKSLLGILLLAAPKGSKITVHAFGEDANDAKEVVASILELAQKQFYMSY